MVAVAGGVVLQDLLGLSGSGAGCGGFLGLPGRGVVLAAGSAAAGGCLVISSGVYLGCCGSGVGAGGCLAGLFAARRYVAGSGGLLVSVGVGVVVLL